jgi:hypothetical protein
LLHDAGVDRIEKSLLELTHISGTNKNISQEAISLETLLTFCTILGTPRLKLSSDIIAMIRGACSTSYLKYVCDLGNEIQIPKYHANLKNKCQEKNPILSREQDYLGHKNSNPTSPSQYQN